MKAKVFYKDGEKSRVKTIEVEQNEPNLIVRKFVEAMRVSRNTYITHIKCGRYDYQWYGDAREAF